MGQKKSKINSADLAHIATVTKFPRKEIEEWYNSLEELYPARKLTLKEFQNLYQNLFPFGDSSSLAQHIFRTYDTDSSNLIDFCEFICGLYLMSKSPLEEKLRWMFKLFDVNNDGVVTKSEMLQVIQAIYEIDAHKHFSVLVKNGLSAEERVERIFCLTDKNGDTSISVEEFCSSALKNTHILELLEIDGIWKDVSCAFINGTVCNA